MTTKLTRQQMIERLRQSDPFADEGQFGKLDLSGCPSFFEAELSELENKKDPFEPADSGTNKRGLKDFLRGLDEDDSAIEDAARMPGAPADLVADFKDRKATDIALRFKKAAGGRYVSTDDNMDALVKTLAESALNFSNMDTEELVTRLQSAGYWTVENLLTVFNSLFDSGTLPDYPEGVYRPLRDEDWEQIARLAQGGAVLPALVYGLRKALDLPNTSTLVIENILADPNRRGLVNSLTLFIFKSGTPGFDERDNEAFEQFLAEFAGGRPWNISTLSEAWKAFQAEKRAVLRDKALGLSQPEAESYEPQDFDKLSDSELENLRIAVLRERAKSK